EMGTDFPSAALVWSWPSKKLGHCIHPRVPEIPIPMVSATTIQPEEYRRDCWPLGSRAMNHHAAPQVTPANTHPFIPPKPEQPRTAQVMPPRATKRSVGRTRSCIKSRRLLLFMFAI